MNFKKFALVVTLVTVFAMSFAAFAAVPALAKEKEPRACENSIVDTALAVNAQSGEFSTLIAALSAANLVGRFDSCAKAKFTVFAPTDAAFAKLGLNAQNIGSAFDKKTLRNILTYHVARGALFSGNVVNREEIRMLNRGTVGVEVMDGSVYLLSNNDPAKIITVDVATDNGVIHIIDTVLLP
jgi:uncharacterized surface protein with fasciclin (FAS1) repeats